MSCKHGNNPGHCGWCKDSSELIEMQKQVARLTEENEALRLDLKVALEAWRKAELGKMLFR